MILASCKLACFHVVSVKFEVYMVNQKPRFGPNCGIKIIKPHKRAQCSLVTNIIFSGVNYTKNSYLAV